MAARNSDPQTLRQTFLRCLPRTRHCDHIGPSGCCGRVGSWRSARRASGTVCSARMSVVPGVDTDLHVGGFAVPRGRGAVAGGIFRTCHPHADRLHVAVVVLAGQIAVVATHATKTLRAREPLDVARGMAASGTVQRGRGDAATPWPAERDSLNVSRRCNGTHRNVAAVPCFTRRR